MEFRNENVHGFLLQQSKTTFGKIFFDDIGIFNSWKIALQRYCIIDGLDFALEEHLGSGAFSKVYRTSDGFAAKVVEKARVREEIALLCFKAELQLHMSLEHPNIVKIYSIHDTGTTYVIKLEYFESQTLQKFLYYSGPTSEADAKKIVHQCLSVFKYLHA